MSLDKKIIKEIERHRKINQYILEQVGATPEQDALGALAPVPGAVPAPAPSEAVPPLPPDGGGSGSQAIDVESDPDVEKIDDKGESEEYFNNLFNQLNDLQSKLGEMDNIMNKLNSLESKIEKYREKTPQEKLELRTYDSYPFSQKLSQFFDDKQDEMEKTGKNDYVLTSDEVTDINVNDIKNSFQPGGGLDKEVYKTSFR